MQQYLTNSYHVSRSVINLVFLVRNEIVLNNRRNQIKAQSESCERLPISARQELIDESSLTDVTSKNCPSDCDAPSSAHNSNKHCVK